jgi:serine/threonine-protein phosphatase 2A activator
MSSSPFQRARDIFFELEEYVQTLRSELTRKDAVIVRLKGEEHSRVGVKSTDNSSCGSVTQNTDGRMSRGIFNHADLANFMASPTCTEMLSFLADLNACARGKRGDSDGNATKKSKKIDEALDRAIVLIDETPPEELDPQRFGNRAFRKWHAKLCAETLVSQGEEFRVYFTRSFGDPNRLDFGTGHEASFLFLLYSIYKQERDTSNLDHFLQVTFPRYLQVVRRLRLVYRLEPAGSHGVWSLDDYHFLPFVLGSSQLCDGHTKPKDLLQQPTFSELTPGSEFFSDALLDILRSKKGPFKEHSPLLHSLSRCASWDELNAGLMKMWRGEVIGKFPVAQHFWFGRSLPITWEHSSDDSVPAPQQQTSVPTSSTQQQNDPLAKYFHLNSFTGSTSQHVIPNSQAGSEVDHVMLADGYGIEIAGWAITCKSESRISGEAELDALKERYPAELDFPLPEMLFSSNFLRLDYNKTIFEFTVDDALRGCKFTAGTPPDRKLIKATMADKWEKRRDQDGNVIKTWREDYDWTFTTRRLLKIMKGDTEITKMTRTPRRIDYEKLKQREPILFAKEILLFEDDLFDLGISKLAVKIRVMPSCFFVLARFFMRVDGAHLRCIDTRVFHVFNTKYVLVENSERESEISLLNGGVHETKDLVDSNYVATILPLVGEPVTYEISLV